MDKRPRGEADIGYMTAINDWEGVEHAHDSKKSRGFSGYQQRQYRYRDIFLTEVHYSNSWMRYSGVDSTFRVRSCTEQ